MHDEQAPPIAAELAICLNLRKFRNEHAYSTSDLKGSIARDGKVLGSTDDEIILLLENPCFLCGRECT